MISKEAKKELNGLLQESFKSLAEGIKGVKSEMPKVAKEIILFQGILGNLLGAAQATLFLAGLGAISYFVNATHPEYWGVHVGTGALACFGIGILSDSIYAAVKAKYAPRLYLLSYVKDLIAQPSAEEK